MGRVADYLTGRDLDTRPQSVGNDESRTLAPTTSRETFTSGLGVGRSVALPAISEAQALRIADVYAAVRVLADGVASLPPRVYRDTGNGRVPAGEDQRLVQLLRRPSPGSTSADLFSHVMVGLLLNGNAFVGKYRSEGLIVQLACLDPGAVTVEQQGARIVYHYASPGGVEELTSADVVHVKAMSSDGLRGLSPVKQAMRVLQLNAALIDYLAGWLGNSTRPGGVLSVTNAPAGEGRGGSPTSPLDDLKEDAEDAYGFRTSAHGRIAIMTGDLTYTPVDPPLREQEFIAQRELSAREVARAMRVPAHMIDAATGDSLTYANVSQQNRFLLDHSLRPWLVRIERAISNDADLCPGGVYLVFDTDALTRMDPDARAAFYAAGIRDGWLTPNEARAREDLPPLPEGAS